MNVKRFGTRLFNLEAKKMGAAKIVGGILVLVGGAFILILLLMWMNFLIDGQWDEISCWILNAAICSLAIVGGILGLVGKRSGGILAIIAGAVAILFGLITVYVTWDMATWPISFFTSILLWFPEPTHIFAGITIESLLILAGGIVIVASGSEK